MPRKIRFNLIGAPQHVIQRARNHESCFFHTEDYLHYLNDLRLSASKYDCRIHAYVLMKNHVHMLVTPMQDFGVSHLIQAIGQRYVTYINKTYQKSGSLWNGRYKSCLIDSGSYLINCMRYIELNPVRAGLVKYPEDYQWSSYCFNVLNADDSFLERHPVFDDLAKANTGDHATYRELFKNDLDANVLNDIREALNQELIYGHEDFKKKIEVLTKRQVSPGRAGRPCIEELGLTYKVGYLL